MLTHDGLNERRRRNVTRTISKYRSRIGATSTNLSPIVYPTEPICRTVNYETIDEQLSNRFREIN